MKTMKDALIFLDTNIFLDFYRFPGSEVGLGLLRKIEEHKDRLIMSGQIEMEYKKNRQNVIVASLASIKSPEWSSVRTPAFLSSARPTKGIESAKKIIKTQIGKIKAKAIPILAEPATHDPVYKVLQRIFKNRNPFNLRAPDKRRFAIRRLARKRFQLGYPPRKTGDTSFGDAVNWEWIVHCAVESGRPVIIVSRDSDYGENFANTPVLNDWLALEFRERVSRRRKIVLTDSVSEAFRMISVPVAKAQSEQEQDLITQSTPVYQLGGSFSIPTTYISPASMVTSYLPAGGLVGLSSVANPFAFQYVKCPKCGGAMHSIGGSSYRCVNCERPPL